MSHPATPMVSAEAAPRGPMLNYRRLVNWAFATFVCSGIISALKPSPYDFLFLIVAPLWLVGGMKIHRGVMFILVLWCILEISGFIALMPYWGDPDPTIYQFQSLYVICTVVFFTLFFAERSIPRAELALNAYTFGALICALLGIASYLNLGGIGALWSLDEGRAAGTFDDPNLYGSYLILSAVYLLQGLLLGTTKRTILFTVSLIILLIGIFVSFSRGSWGALINASLLMGIAGYLTVRSKRTRHRIVMMSAATLGLGVATFCVLLSQPEMRQTFFERATLAKSYDEGITGRFGNQLRSIPMLLDRPEGFGPLRFRDFFHLEPHNSYVGAFANDGWLGGFTWIIIVASTIFVGFRLMFARSPFQQLAQVFWPVLLSWLLQGFQIDIDHWRQLFLCFGAVWGFEAARLRWSAHQRREAAAPQTKGELCSAGPMP
jgi:hypothetical protein